jgi:hypothetical protein
VFCRQPRESTPRQDTRRRSLADTGTTSHKPDGTAWGPIRHETYEWFSLLSFLVTFYGFLLWKGLGFYYLVYLYVFEYPLEQLVYLDYAHIQQLLETLRPATFPYPASQISLQMEGK